MGYHGNKHDKARIFIHKYRSISISKICILVGHGDLDGGVSADGENANLMILILITALIQFINQNLKKKYSN